MAWISGQQSAKNWFSVFGPVLLKKPGNYFVYILGAPLLYVFSKSNPELITCVFLKSDIDCSRYNNLLFWAVIFIFTFIRLEIKSYLQ